MFLLIQGQDNPAGPASSAACQPIAVPFCTDLLYTETVLPNTVGHRTQEDAHLVLQTFTPLIQWGCSPHLKPFLCSVYLPECVSGQPRPPCRTLCEQVKSSCMSVLTTFGFQWPEALKCEAFTTESCEHVSLLCLTPTQR